MTNRTDELLALISRRRKVTVDEAARALWPRLKIASSRRPASGMLGRLATLGLARQIWEMQPHPVMHFVLTDEGRKHLAAARRTAARTRPQRAAA